VKDSGFSPSGFAWGVFEKLPDYRLVAVHTGLSDEQFCEMVEACGALGYDVAAICPRCERSLFDCYSLTVAHPATGFRPPLARHVCLTQIDARALEQRYREDGFCGTHLCSATPPSAEDFLPPPPCPACAAAQMWDFDHWACRACEPEGGTGVATLIGEVPF